MQWNAQLLRVRCWKAIGHCCARVFLLVLLLSGRPATADLPETLTWDHVYGASRLTIHDPAPTDFRWINDSLYVRGAACELETVRADTGQVRPLYDAEILRRRLEAAGVDPQEAERISDGGWKRISVRQQIIVARSKDRLIRADLDGTRVSFAGRLPGKTELHTLSPTGSACAFVSGNELWSADFDSGSVRQLTTGAGPDIRNGKADWVYFEEVYLRKWKAFRFSPNGQFLLFQQFDDTHVPTFQITDHSGVRQHTETQHFPKAGERNPDVRLGVVSVYGGVVTWIPAPEWLGEHLIVYFDWYPDSRHIYWYAQNRTQTWLDIIRSNPVDGASVRVLHDSSEAWVDNPGRLTFLNDGSFLFFSEQSGWKHLYRSGADDRHVRPVTSGDWEVRRLHVVNEPGGFAIVTGTRDSHIAENVYRVSLNDNSVTRLSPEAGHHKPSVNPSGNRIVDSWSTHVTRTSVVLRNAEGNRIREIHSARPVEEQKVYRFGNVSIRRIPMADGEFTDALFLFPPEFDSKQRHPVWLLSYGGPHFPKVRDAWQARLDDHLLANLGIVVIHIDPWTASGRGGRSAWKAWHRLGVEETRDIVAICDWLADQSWADADRIGLSGHSYGGFLTAYAMTHCDCLCAGIAGAPVTDWANYDTIYTERYMGTPQENRQRYRQSSAVAAASRLHGRLLLVHGLMDNNVHPTNTLQLADALQKAGRSFELMLYPRARHTIRNTHYSKLRFNFIVESLGMPEHCRP